MKLRNIHQCSVFILLGATVLNCGTYKGKYGKTIWIEFKEDENFNAIMKRWQNKEFV